MASQPSPPIPDNVEFLPIWKKGSTAEEFLLELAMVARKHPERFEKLVLVSQETLPSGQTKVDYFTRKVSTIEVLGLLELGKMEIIRYTCKT